MRKILDELGIIIVIVTVILLFITFMTPFNEQVNNASSQVVDNVVDKTVNIMENVNKEEIVYTDYTISTSGYDTSVVSKKVILKLLFLKLSNIMV